MATKRQHAEASTRRRGGAAKLGLLLAAVVGSAYLMAAAVGTALHLGLVWLILIPWFLSIRKLVPLWAMGAGALWGASLYLFSAAGANNAFSPTIQSFALLTIVSALYAYAGAWVTSRIGFSPLVLGLGWVGVELALQPLGLRNGLIAGTQGGGGFVQAVGEGLGYVFVAFGVVFVGALLFSLFSWVRLKLPRPPLVIGLSDSRRPLSLRSVVFVPLLGTTPSQPRAPPAFALS